MKITLIQALLIGIVYYLGNIGTPWLSLLGSISVVYKPLVAGTLVGFILGDPVSPQEEPLLRTRALQVQLEPHGQ